MTSNNKPNALRYEDLIRAVLNGKSVQYRRTGAVGEWYDTEDTLGNVIISLVQNSRYDTFEYRLKPQPLVKWCAIQRDSQRNALVLGKLHREAAAEDAGTVRVLRLELDPDTLDVISATTEAP